MPEGKGIVETIVCKRSRNAAAQKAMPDIAFADDSKQGKLRAPNSPSRGRAAAELRSVPVPMVRKTFILAHVRKWVIRSYRFTAGDHRSIGMMRPVVKAGKFEHLIVKTDAGEKNASFKRKFSEAPLK